MFRNLKKLTLCHQRGKNFTLVSKQMLNCSHHIFWGTFGTNQVWRVLEAANILQILQLETANYESLQIAPFLPAAMGLNPLLPLKQRCRCVAKLSGDYSEDYKPFSESCCTPLVVPSCALPAKKHGLVSWVASRAQDSWAFDYHASGPAPRSRVIGGQHQQIESSMWHHSPLHVRKLHHDA